ncbi:MAG: hypothetical protein WBO61_07395, partial [Gemmiger qucibialis]
VASIGPCKWFAAFGITSKVSPRRGESTHLRPESRLTAVGLETRLRAQRPATHFYCSLQIIKLSIGNGLDRSETLLYTS